MPTSAETDQTADQGDQRPEMPQQHDLKPGEGAHHEDFAVREMQKTQHSKDQRVPDGDQRVGAAEHHPVCELLQKH